jgi:hypothetical protein
VSLQAGAERHGVDARQIGGKTIAVCAGTTSAKPDGFWTRNALQNEAAPKSGFIRGFHPRMIIPGLAPTPSAQAFQ